MSTAAPGAAKAKQATVVREWISLHLGISNEHKRNVYIDISRSATLLDVGYWLQIVFAAGIATLGLVLNSPAVIIGAMLISPLMGPILSAGLSLAAGDLVLAIRSAANLLLSCLLSVGTAALLVWLLPFKEVTAEIAARTQPNTLDLAVALFSGAIGSISMCQTQKGLVTSIPGVAIAVALMPPLSVIGFGVGVVGTINRAEALRIAGGGGLLFLTNLVAITFTAMLVFLVMHLNAREIRKEVRAWAEQDVESAWLRGLLLQTTAIRRLRGFRSLPMRLFLALAALVLLAIPLSKSFTRLKNEIRQKHYENDLLRVASTRCEQPLGPGAKVPRCYVGSASLKDANDKIMIDLRLFTRKPYSADEREAYVRQIAALLKRPPESVLLQLIEIPTTSGDLQAQTREQPRVLTIAQLRSELLSLSRPRLENLPLPAPAQLIDYELSEESGGGFRVKISYLNDHALGQDAQYLLASDIAARLQVPDAAVEFDQVPMTVGPVKLPVNRAQISRDSRTSLDDAARFVRNHPMLVLGVELRPAARERTQLRELRNATITEYFHSQWRLPPDRVRVTEGNVEKRVPALYLTFTRQKPSQ